MPQSRRWWTETTRHLTNLRTSLVKQKILPPLCKKHNVPKTFVTTLVHSTKKIDEIAARGTKTGSNIPIYPKLRLSRPNKYKKVNKIQVPVTVTLLEFPQKYLCMNN